MVINNKRQDIDIVPCHTIAVWVQINYIEVDVLKNTGTYFVLALILTRVKIICL